MVATHDLRYLQSTGAGLFHGEQPVFVVGEQRPCPGAEALQWAPEGPMPPLDTQPPALVLCSLGAAVHHNRIQETKYVRSMSTINLISNVHMIALLYVEKESRFFFFT